MKKKILTGVLVILAIVSVWYFNSYAKVRKDFFKRKDILKGQKVLMIIAFNNFRDEEYFYPRKVLEEAGAKIVVASSKLGKATSMVEKKKVSIDSLLSDVDSKQFNGVIFVGGSGAQSLWENKDAKRLAKEFASERKPIGAICIAPVILTNAGVLTGKEATCWPGVSKLLLKKKVKYVDKEVCIEKPYIVTANGPTAAKEFAEAFKRLLINKFLEKK